jgi:histidinol-phosphate aminotransferase
MQSMFREAISTMTPYVPGEQPRPGQTLIKLNTNENPYPPSPQVRRAITNAARGDALRLYPPPNADDFVAAAARRYGLPQRMILAGNGSDELLAMLFRATLGRGDRVTYATPTYSLYQTLAAMQEARVLAPPLGSDFELPVEALAGAGARLTIVCSPNSPSGTITPWRTLDRLAHRIDGRLLAIDEAYVDFADENALRLARDLPNVIVLRSLSKSYSLAGMRLGLCFARPEIIEELRKIKDSYNLSRIAIAAGAAALDDEAWMRRNVERVKRTRAATVRRLNAIGFHVPTSSANFVLARMPGVDLGPLAAGLRKRGILVRHFADLPDGIRISIGKTSEMRALFAALAPLVTAFAASRRNGRSRK